MKPTTMSGLLKCFVFPFCLSLFFNPVSLDESLVWAGDPQTILVGTYTGGGSKGVYRLELNLETGQLQQRGLVAQLDQPSFLASSPKLPGYFYVVGETEQFETKAGGSLSLLKYQPETGTASLISQQATLGAAPCHVICSSDGKFTAVANYSGGSFTVFDNVTSAELNTESPLSLGAGFCFQNAGSSVNQSRQEGPHGHCVRFLPGSTDRLIAADLGTDQLLLLQLKVVDGQTQLQKVGQFKMPAGCGPRQIDFHPNGKWLYVINELDSTMSHLTMPTQSGEIELLQTVSTLPSEFKGNSSTAHLQVHPSGNFVYGSNRGHDSIAMFAIDSTTGNLNAMGHCLTGGSTPRHFLVEPSGKFLLAANQGSGSIVVFPIDSKTGILGTSQFQAAVPNPVCLLPFATK